MRAHSLFLALFALLPALLPAAPLNVVADSVKIEVVVRATMHGFTGKLDHAAVALASEPGSGAILSATVGFAWADLKTGDTARDKEMVAWATAHAPAGSFSLTTLTPAAAPDSYTAAGSLTLNGQTKAITFPAKIVRTATGWTISGLVAIDHRDWGLPKIRKFGFLTVDPNVTIRFSLAATG